LKKDLFPLKKCSFDGIKVFAPNNGIPYLDRMYPTWRTEAKIDIRTFDDEFKTNKIDTVTIPLTGKWAFIE